MIILISINQIYNIYMSYPELLSQNKILAYFTLDSSINVQESPLLQPSAFTIMIYHYHYPIVYFQQIYQHFQYCLPKQAAPGNLRIFNGKEQLPSELPLGLFIQGSPICLTVRVDLSLELPSGFRVIKNSWKKAFEIINENRRCDYVKSRLSQAQLLKKYDAYCHGQSHNFQNQGLYEGTFIMVKGFCDGHIIERKYKVSIQQTLQEIVKNLFGFEETDMQKLKNGKMRVKSHNLPINLKMSTKQFLDEWSYNDGYCYLKLELQSTPLKTSKAFIDQ